MIELKSYTQVSLDTIQTNTKRRLAQNIAALEAWKNVKHLTKKDGTEFKFISKSFENAKIDYDFSGKPVLKVCFHDDYNGYSNDEIWLYDSYNAYSKTQKYPENTYIDRVHYLTPLEAMEVVNEKIKYYENVIILNQRIIAGNAQFTGIAAGRGVGFTTGLLHLRKGLGMRETPIRPHSWH